MVRDQTDINIERGPEESHSRNESILPIRSIPFRRVLAQGLAAEGGRLVDSHRGGSKLCEQSAEKGDLVKY